MEKASLAQALRHPNWEMGEKITIDSATLMNKGFEVIEARWLFGIPQERIEVAIHHQSIVHSMVEFIDGSIIAHLGIPDMRIPIANALSYPERLTNQLPSLDITQVGALTFEKPDLDLFPCLRYAYSALKIGKTMPTVLNAANEVAVQAFLRNTITFLDIPRIIEKTMDRHSPSPILSLEDVLAADRWSREMAASLLPVNKGIASGIP
jgi:1-deoxy-D-xylulose-5-phosphate reductoisomerase